jgi:hypothetical protein
MIIRKTDDNSSAYDDDFGDIPLSGFWAKWFGGVCVPLVLVGYGVVCCITRHGTLPGDRSSDMDVSGVEAIALGIASASLGLFLHCHYFWGNIYHLSAWATIGKIVSAMAFICSLVYLIIRIGLFG